MTNKEGPELSDREKQLLELAARGLTDTAISNKLGISEATVSTYWGRIRAKLGPFSRTELVATMIRERSEKVVQGLRAENEALAHKLKMETGESADGNFYKALLEHAPDAILIVRKDGVIETLNAAAAQLFGYEIDELIGAHVSSLLPDRFRHIHSLHIAEYTAAPTRKHMGDHLATPALHKSGREIPIDASISAVGAAGGLSVICIVREIKHI